MTTKIEWAKETWNPITGCTKISEGCQNCYAERMAKRLAGRFGYPADDPFKPGTFHADKLQEPLKWKRPRKVFVCSMGDILHDKVDGSDLVKVFDVMVKCPQHTFIILTKRADRLAWFNLNGPLIGKEPLPNLWLGVTAENQRTADERIPHLLRTEAVVKLVSVEPMLEAMDISYWLNGAPRLCGYDRWEQTHPPLDWCVVGGETGPGARPMRPEWAESLRNQCNMAGVPFFFKSWGNWVAPSQMPLGTYREIEDFGDGIGISDNPLGVGKKRSGRLLDGREWNEYPEVDQH